MNAIADFEPTESCFISHDVRDLPNSRVAEIRAQGYPVLCWTVRSVRKETKVRPHVDNITFENFALPVMTMALYGMGYIARMTRASMAEVMTTHYIRTAVLKGLPYKTVIMRHALRNALIAPFTVIVLQLNWLLSGVIVVVVFFAYKGFGKLLLDAALY